MGYGSQKSHHLLPATQSPRRAGGIIQPQSTGPRTRRDNVQGRRRWCPSSRRERVGTDSPSPVCLSGPSVEGGCPNGKAGPLHSGTEAKANLSETRSQTRPEVMFSQLLWTALSPVGVIPTNSHHSQDGIVPLNVSLTRSPLT